MPELKKLESLLKAGVISRREFIAGLSALGLTATITPGLFSSPARADTPKRGGRARIGFSAQSPTDTLDPAMGTAGMDFGRSLQFYNTLTWLSPNMEPIPELAESWEASKDVKTWHFKLREGVTFHSGKPFEAEDVIYTLNRIMAEGSKSSAKTLAADIVDIAADGKYMVKITLQNPNADLPVLFAVWQFAIVENNTENFDKPAGTGPFMLKEFKAGVRSIGVRNPNYFKEGLPYIDEVEYFAISDPPARVNALISGDVHAIAEVPHTFLKQIDSSPGCHPVFTKGGLFVNFNMMCDKKPFDNPDLRMAFKYLMDRPLVLKKLYKGLGSLGNDNFIGSAYRYYCDKNPIREMDLDKAKHYFKKAGAEGGTFDLFGSDAPGMGAMDQALMLQQQAAKVGVKVNVKRVPSDGYWSHTWMKKPFHLSGWNMRPTTDIMLTLAYKSDAPWNESQWKNEKFDQLLIQARSELDPAIRQDLYCEMQGMISDTGGTLLSAFIDYVDAVSDKVKNFIPVPLSSFGGHKLYETMWLDT